MTKTISPQDFEKSLTKLNAIVDKMQSGNLALEQSLSYFEDGVALINQCQQALQQAQQKVKILTANNKLDDFSNDNRT